MFCQKCGKQMEEGSRFCPYCGAKNELEPKQKEQIIPDEKGKREREKRTRKKRKAPVIIIIAVLVIFGIALSAGGGSSPSSEELIALVQNGYLGNYDTVTIKEVLDSMDENAEWNAGEAASGGYYIVEYKGADITIQFSVNSPEDELFKVLGIEIPGMESSGMEAYDVKIYLDSIYQLYAIDHPEKGLYIDMNASNDTLEGHIGSVRAAEAENVHSVQTESAGATVTRTESVEEPSYAEEPPMEESQDSEQNQNFVAEALTYGTYSFDDGTGTTSTAEIGFYTDEYRDYIRIECWRNDSEIVYFQGILEKNGENYCAYCEEIGTGIFVTFADGGFYVEVTASDFPDIEYMEGFYSLTEALNLNEVA